MTDTEPKLYQIRYVGGSTAIVDQQHALDAARVFRRQNHPSYFGERAIAAIVPLEGSDPAERAGAALPALSILHCVVYAGRMIPPEWECERCAHCGRTMSDWLRGQRTDLRHRRAATHAA